ncbi:hypothetical protein DMENIID0001_057110 [Sergentomyia squamirostris]
MPLWNTGLNPLTKSALQWRRPKITLQNPRLLGSYSIIEGKFVNTIENMRYLCLPKQQVKWDLNTGFSIKDTDTSKADWDMDGLDHILKYIEANPDKINVAEDELDSGKKIFPDFVTERGFLSILMQTPCSQGKKSVKWTVRATKTHGTHYLWWIENWIERLDDEKSQRLCYYGYKFRQMLTTHNLNKPTDIDEPLVREAFLGVFDNKIGEHRVLYAGEIYGVESDGDLDIDANLSEVKIIEMHTKVKMDQEYFHKTKLLHWWCNTALMGVETVYAGVRTYAGILKSIEPIAVKEMPKMASSHWSHSVCLEFAIAFLDIVKDAMIHENDPDTVYQFTYNPNDCDQVQYEIFRRKSDLSFLPSWYINIQPKTCATG